MSDPVRDDQEYLAVCPSGHRSYLRLRGVAIPALGIEADPEVKGRCSRCGLPAELRKAPAPPRPAGAAPSSGP
jgi:hypothetical protein